MGFARREARSKIRGGGGSLESARSLASPEINERGNLLGCVAPLALAKIGSGDVLMGSEVNLAAAKS